MANWLQICAVHGAVSLPGQDDGAAELQLWYEEESNLYGIRVVKSTGGIMLVCELLINVLLFHFQECTEKIKTLY